jgi:hypothetical protein
MHDINYFHEHELKEHDFLGCKDCQNSLNIIMVGADAVPKTAIFAHLAQVLDPGQMIPYRVYEKGLRRVFDPGTGIVLPPQFKECARIQPDPPVNNTPVFAVRT